MKINLIIKKLKLKFFSRFIKPEEFNNMLRMEGISVGKGTIFYGPNSQTIDRQRVWMLRIGDYCKITQGVILLQHDYSRSVLRRVYGDIVAEAGETVIGNNVFIGMNSIILMGANIGNNVIIGAGSVISGVIPDNVVVAGNPARVIRTLDEHYKIRKSKYVNEAKLYARTFYSTYNKLPSIHDMGAFFPLYLKRNLNSIIENNLSIKLNGDSYEEILKYFLDSDAVYENFDSFLKDTFDL